jgi:hypothetical protein
MGQLSEQKSNSAEEMANELLQVLVEKTTNNEKAIRENTAGMSQLTDTRPILKEIGVRITAQEKQLEELKGGFGHVQAGIEKMAEKIAIPTEPISKLSADLKKHAEFFLVPRQKEVHYRYFLGKPALTLGVAILIIGLLATLLIRSYGRAEEHAANDLKWRYVNLWPDSVLFKALHLADERYKSDPEQFRKGVIDEEDRKQELFEKFELQNKTKQEIIELEEKKKQQ